MFVFYWIYINIIMCLTYNSLGVLQRDLMVVFAVFTCSLAFLAQTPKALCGLSMTFVQYMALFKQSEMAVVLKQCSSTQLMVNYNDDVMMIFSPLVWWILFGGQ